MTKETTGKAVRDVKGATIATEKQPVTNQVQIHQGNVSVLTVHFLSKISESLERIAKGLEQS